MSKLINITELSKLLGNDTEFHFKSGKVNKVLMLGIQGSGKTTVANIFKQLGAPVYFSDDRAKDW